jgi:hypothetical protein
VAPHHTTWPTYRLLHWCFVSWTKVFLDVAVVCLHLVCCKPWSHITIHFVWATKRSRDSCMSNLLTVTYDRDTFNEGAM